MFSKSVIKMYYTYIKRGKKSIDEVNVFEWRQEIQAQLDADAQAEAERLAKLEAERIEAERLAEEERKRLEEELATQQEQTDPDVPIEGEV